MQYNDFTEPRSWLCEWSLNFEREERHWCAFIRMWEQRSFNLWQGNSGAVFDSILISRHATFGTQTQDVVRTWLNNSVQSLKDITARFHTEREQPLHKTRSVRDTTYFFLRMSHLIWTEEPAELVANDLKSEQELAFWTKHELLQKKLPPNLKEKA